MLPGRAGGRPELLPGEGAEDKCGGARHLLHEPPHSVHQQRRLRADHPAAEAGARGPLCCSSIRSLWSVVCMFTCVRCFDLLAVVALRSCELCSGLGVEGASHFLSRPLCGHGAAGFVSMLACLPFPCAVAEDICTSQCSICLVSGKLRHSTVSMAFSVSTSTDEHQQFAMSITIASRWSIQATQHVGKDRACAPWRLELHVLARR